MKRLLIISPYFPPANAADMQRVRMSLPYYHQFGWEAEVVTVDCKYIDIGLDELLLETVPKNVIIHRIKALNKQITTKIGLGSVALRSLYYYRKKVNSLLKQKNYDLIYFSTTQFPVCILGAYWKKKFKIPYVIDLQDPWHSNYYKNKPKNERPKKYWLSYRLNKYLEPLALRHADGIISVSENYISDIKTRYPELENAPSSIITFSAFPPDMQIAIHNRDQFPPILLPDFINLVYIGRGGRDMHKAIIPVFAALRLGMAKQSFLFSKLKLYFIGTSYAPAGQGEQTIMPLARIYGIENQIIEITDRISYYRTLSTLQAADALFIPGSDDPAYSASKIYPYLLANRPLLAVINADSPIAEILKEYNIKDVYTYNKTPEVELKVMAFLMNLLTGAIDLPDYNINAIEKYGAKNMTKKQCLLFNNVLEQVKFS